LTRVKSDLNKYVGWWNSITGADFDQDGDTDYVIGNLGLNNGYNVSEDKPLRVFAKDLDNNGSTEALLFCYTKMADGFVTLKWLMEPNNFARYTFGMS